MELVIPVQVPRLQSVVPVLQEARDSKVCVLRASEAVLGNSGRRGSTQGKPRGWRRWQLAVLALTTVSNVTRHSPHGGLP